MDADLPLLEAVRRGNESALEGLMERHQEPLFYFVLRYTGNEATARDVVQETFVRTYFKATSFKPKSTVKTWIYTIALNLCRDAGRRHNRRPVMVSLDQPGPGQGANLELKDESSTPDEVASRTEELASLRAAIQRLPKKLKAPLVLCILEQRSQKEAAEILSTTPKTIELRIYRARKKLARILARS